METETYYRIKAYKYFEHPCYDDSDTIKSNIRELCSGEINVAIHYPSEEESYITIKDIPEDDKDTVINILGQYMYDARATEEPEKKLPRIERDSSIAKIFKRRPFKLVRPAIFKPTTGKKIFGKKKLF